MNDGWRITKGIFPLQCREANRCTMPRLAGPTCFKYVVFCRVFHGWEPNLTIFDQYICSIVLKPLSKAVRVGHLLFRQNSGTLWLVSWCGYANWSNTLCDFCVFRPIAAERWWTRFSFVALKTKIAVVLFIYLHDHENRKKSSKCRQIHQTWILWVVVSQFMTSQCIILKRYAGLTRPKD